MLNIKTINNIKRIITKLKKKFKQIKLTNT